MKLINQTKFLTQSLLLLVLVGSVSTKVFGCEQEQDQPRIILHVDINKTLIAEDSGKELGPVKCISTLLSADPVYAHTWGDGLEKITYKKYVDEKLFPGSYDDLDLKKKRENCYAEFVEVARIKNHPMFNEIDREFNSLINALDTQGSRKVFQSFSHLVAYLKKGNYPFSVILRTFGDDLDVVSRELAQDLVSQELAQDDLFIHGSFCKGVLHLNDRKLSKPAEMIAAFEPGKHYAINDHYDWWIEHNQTEKGGKPFPIDIADKRVLSFFFDDNANNAKRQILNIMTIGEKITLKDLIAMGRVVAVETRKAILDGNYFITPVENVLKKW